MFTSSRKSGDDDIYFFEILDTALSGNQIADIIPVANEEQEPIVNQKPSVEKTVAEKAEAPPSHEQIIEGETPAPPHDSYVPGMPDGYQSSKSPSEKPEKENQKEIDDPFANPAKEIETEEKIPAEKAATSQSSNIFFEIPEKGEKKIKPKKESTAPVVGPSSFKNFMDNAFGNNLLPGQVYRIDGATFDRNVWQLTPKISRKLNDVAAVLRRFPSLQIELAAHTPSPGPAKHNLELSQNRANMAVEYLIKEGIAANRIKGVGYGETQPLNHCLEGIGCPPEDHFFNQRFEVRVLKGIEQ